MNRLIMAAALAAGCTLVSSAPALAAAKNYDCSKAGNANKAACKNVAKTGAPAAKVAAAPKAVATKSVSRSYDCTKAGNANKTQCKSSTTVIKTVAKAAPAPATKPSLLQRMSTALGGGAAKPASPTHPAAVQRRTAAAAPASVEDRNPAGAIAQCKDGTYSHAKGRTGACSRHGGVAKWS